MNKVEQWKYEKHGLDVWPDLLGYAQRQTPMDAIDDADLERMKWYGVFYRKRDGEGTYMLRIRLTAGELSSAQAREIAFIAYELGYGIIDLTTRANIQVQGLSLANVPKALERLKTVGLTAQQTGHDNVRTVYCHPLSGVDAEELIDARPLCREVTELFLGDRFYSDLPRKFNIGICGKPGASLHYWTQDIGLLATRGPDGETMFHLVVGGNQGQNPHLACHLPVLVPPERVVEVVRALLNLFCEQGSREKRDRARFAYLVEALGVEGVLAELDQRLEMPLVPCTSPPELPAGHDDLVGWLGQRQAGKWALGLAAPVGRLGWQQLEGLSIAAKRWASGMLRCTLDQGIVVVDVPTGFKDAVATMAARYGLSGQADSIVRNVVACTGKQFCNIAVTETKAHALKLIDELRRRALAMHGIRIHISGCPSACALHHTADIGLKGVRVRRLLGTREGFDVYLGGGINSQLHLALPYKTGVDVDQLPQLVEEVLREFYLRHKPGQTFSSFWRERLRDTRAAATGERDYCPPVWECERCGHHFHGEDPPIYCPQCAGLRRHFARLELEDTAEPLPAASEAAPQPSLAEARADLAFAAGVASLSGSV